MSTVTIHTLDQHNKELFNKLRDDLNTIVEDILDYLPDHRLDSLSRVDLDVDLVLKLHHISKQNHGRYHKHTTPKHNNMVLPPISRNYGIGTFVPYNSHKR